MRKISVVQASLLFKKTNRTIYNWIMQDEIKSDNGLYELEKLQQAYDKRHNPKPRFDLTRFS
jgi:hypothetical protein